MTPKEKAIDLVRDMEFEIPYVHDPTEPQGDDIAKKCALIAVQEILNILEYPSPQYSYYLAVKTEIEKL